MPEAPPGGRTSWRIVAAIVAVAFLLRLPGHLNSGLWFDEIWVLLETVRLPFGAFYTTFASDNNHPFFSLLAWISVRLFGESAWALRLPAVLFGAASIGMLWVLALGVTTRRRAAVATGLMTISYHHVWFSQNARGYTMLLFWTLAATHFLLAEYRGRGRRNWIAYAVCLALATYTHSSGVFVAVAHGVVALVVLAMPASEARAGRRWTPWAGIVLAGVISLALHAAILGDMIAYFSADAAAGVGDTGVTSEWNSPWWTVRAVAESLGVGLWPGLAALGVAGATLAVGAWDLARKDWRAALLFLLPAVVGIGATMALGRPVRPRFVFHLGGFLLVIVVGGVFTLCGWLGHVGGGARAAPRARRLETVASVLMVALSLLILPRAYTLPKQDFEGALAFAEELRRQGEEVVVTGLTVLPYAAYYRAGFAEVASAEELDALLPDADDRVYVLHTIPIFLESRAPPLARRLAAGKEVARFPGSLGGGDVVVLEVGRGAP